MRFSNCHLLEEKDNAKILGVNTFQRVAPKSTVQLHCVIPCIYHREYWIGQEFRLLTSGRNCYRNLSGALNYSMLNSWCVLRHNIICSSHWLATSTHSTCLWGGRGGGKTVSKLTEKLCIFFLKLLAFIFIFSWILVTVSIDDNRQLNNKKTCLTGIVKKAWLFNISILISNIKTGFSSYV